MSMLKLKDAEIYYEEYGKGYPVLRHCQIKILSIFPSPNSCRKSQGFCALHGRPRITFST